MPSKPQWFCLRSLPKHEHIAAAHLQSLDEVDVFLPRVRFQRSTRQGMAWVTEALFPNYLFARFEWQEGLRRVRAVRGVRDVIHFGDRWPVIPEAAIEELRQAVGAEAVCTISANLLPGDAVQLISGAMRGLTAVVSRVMPARERVAVLMDFLGRTTEIEMPANSLLKEGNARVVVLPSPAPKGRP